MVLLFVFMTLSFVDIMSTRPFGPLTLERCYLCEKNQLTERVLICEQKGL